MRLRDIALIPQGAMSSLNPVMRLEDQIIDAIVGARAEDVARGARRARRRAARAASGSIPAVARRYPHELSGGMKQRAVMAIATSLSPKVIVADEPTSALDVVVQRQVMQTLGRLQGGLGAAVVLIGHDMGLIAQFADTVGRDVRRQARRDRPGRADDRGAAAPLYPAPGRQPARASTSKQALIGIPGLPPPLVDLPPGCSFNPRCPYAFDRCRRETPAAAGGGAGPARGLPPLSRAHCVCRRCRPAPPSRRSRRERADRAAAASTKIYGAFTALDDITLIAVGGCTLDDRRSPARAAAARRRWRA